MRNTKSVWFGEHPDVSKVDQEHGGTYGDRSYVKRETDLLRRI